MADKLMEKAPAIAGNHRGRTLLTDDVTEKILQLIKDRDLAEGDRLPTEAELTEMFGVSRIVVRESIKALSFFGLLDTRARRGSVVGSLDVERLGRCLSFQMGVAHYSREAILEARITIEVSHLSLVAKNLTEESVQQLMEFVMACEDAALQNDPAAFSEHDRDMHTLMLEVGGNPILMTFCALLRQYFTEEGYSSLTQKQMLESAHEHRVFIEALRDHNVLLARGMLLKHLGKGLQAIGSMGDWQE
jgi:GntR family transcriptional repressor for pyruvate dehydrogenase complex